MNKGGRGCAGWADSRLVLISRLKNTNPFTDIPECIWISLCLGGR